MVSLISSLSLCLRIARHTCSTPAAKQRIRLNTCLFCVLEYYRNHEKHISFYDVFINKYGHIIPQTENVMVADFCKQKALGRSITRKKNITERFTLATRLGKVASRDRHTAALLDCHVLEHLKEGLIIRTRHKGRLFLSGENKPLGKH